MSEGNLRQLHEVSLSLVKDTEAALLKAEKNKIQLLHEYNDLKDSAQIVIGILAEKEGVTIKELHERYGLPLKDA